MTLCRLQFNYSSTVTLQGGPVVLRPVRATPCFILVVIQHLSLRYVINDLDLDFEVLKPLSEVTAV